MTSGFQDPSWLLVPEEAEVEMEVDLEPGDTHQDRLLRYTTALETKTRSHPEDFETLAKMHAATAPGVQRANDCLRREARDH